LKAVVKPFPKSVIGSGEGAAIDVPEQWPEEFQIDADFNSALGNLAAFALMAVPFIVLVRIGQMEGRVNLPKKTSSHF